LKLDTCCDDTTPCVVDVLFNTLKVSNPSANVKCEKLKTKVDTNAPFAVILRVDELFKQDAIDLIMSGDSWPEGVLVRKF
jgi:hypothetical protein